MGVVDAASADIEQLGLMMAGESHMPSTITGGDPQGEQR